MEKTIPIQEKKLEELVDTLDRLGDQLRHRGDFSCETPLKELEETVGKLELSSLASIVKPLEAMALETAVQLGKQVQCEWSGFDFEINPSLKNSLFTALTHAVRNAVDHGIEAPTERVSKGKNAFGKIKFLTKLKGGALEVRVRDDGRGVQGEDLSHLFSPGFSTAKKVTVISGRGMGLDAVKAFAKDSQGSAILQEISPHGLELFLRIPLDRVGLEVVPVTVGREIFWFRSEDFVCIDESNALGKVRVSLAETLGMQQKVQPGKIIRFCTEFSSPDVFEVEKIGTSQFKIFRPLDPLWIKMGPPWLKRWIQVCEGHVIACRGYGDPESLGLSLLGDPESLYAFMTNSVAQF